MVPPWLSRPTTNKKIHGDARGFAGGPASLIEVQICRARRVHSIPVTLITVVSPARATHGTARRAPLSTGSSLGHSPPAHVSPSQHPATL